MNKYYCELCGKLYHEHQVEKREMPDAEGEKKIVVFCPVCHCECNTFLVAEDVFKELEA